MILVHWARNSFYLSILVRLWNKKVFFKQARIRYWNQPVLSDEGKVCCSRKQREPFDGARTHVWQTSPDWEWNALPAASRLPLFVLILMYLNNRTLLCISKTQNKCRSTAFLQIEAFNLVCHYNGKLQCYTQQLIKMSLKLLHGDERCHLLRFYSLFTWILPVGCWLASVLLRL